MFFGYCHLVQTQLGYDQQGKHEMPRVQLTHSVASLETSFELSLLTVGRRPSYNLFYCSTRRAGEPD